MNSRSCDSGCNDDEKNMVLEDPGWDDCRSLNREHVNALLSVSEEQTFQEQDLYEVQNDIGWEDAIQGWGQCAPLVCLFYSQKKGRKAKSDVMESHCLLCTDLKDLKQSEFLVSDRTGSSCESAKEPSSTVLLNKVRRDGSSSSASEEETPDFTFQERNIRSDPLSNKLMFGNEQCIHSKTLPQHLWPVAQCPCLKDRATGKVTLVSSLIVLPPVKPSTSSNLSSNILNRREARDLFVVEAESNPVAVFSATGPVTFDEKVGVDGDVEKAVVIPYGSSAVDTCHGSLTSKHRPSQHQYHLLSIPVSKKGQLSFTTLGDKLPQTPSLLGQNLRRDEFTRSPLRHSSGHRLHLPFKAKSMRRAEPELPMLLGTRVAVPVSTHRLL